MTGVLRPPGGYSVIEHASLASTNDEATKLAATGAATGTVVWAHRQTAGRGRRGRTWYSPEGNLYCSLVLRPDVTPTVAAQLSLVAAVATADVVAGFLAPNARIEQKWPNDVLVDGVKIAGILLESSGTTGRRIDWVVIGVGLNVAAAPDQPDVQSTSLRQQGAEDITAAAALEALLESLHGWYQRWETAGIGPVRGAWLGRARGIGQPITVRLPDEEIHGRFADMDESGALLLDLSDGQSRRITAGDVFYST